MRHAVVHTQKFYITKQLDEELKCTRKGKRKQKATKVVGVGGLLTDLGK